MASHRMAIPLVSLFHPVGYRSQMQKSYSERRVFPLSRRFFSLRYLINLIWGTALLLFSLTGCSKHHKKSPQQQIDFYESKARHYLTLSDLQSLSPPYSINRATRFRIHNHLQNMRMVYLMEAKKFSKLAEKARDQLNLDANQSMETKN